MATAMEGDVEDIREYTLGGYAKVDIGEVLGSKYEVVDKLGHSEFSTVWLCWNTWSALPGIGLRWVAIKIFKLDWSLRPLSQMEKKKELISKGGKEAKWTAAHLGMPIDEFHHNSINGFHRCLVMPVLGPSLEAMEPKKRSLLKISLFQTARALRYLHNHQVCHGQAVPKCIRYQLDMESVDKLSVRQMKYRLGLESRKRKLATKVPTAPDFLISPVDRFKIAGLTRSIILVPSGAADFVDLPLQYQAPEVVTGLKTGPGSDVWSFCCTVAYIYAKCSITISRMKGTEAELAEYIKTLERLLGPIRRPSAYVEDDEGKRRYLPPRHMCESEEDYENWKRIACVPPWTSPMKALLGSLHYRSHFAPKPILPEAFLSEPEAEELGTLLESALSFDEPKRSMHFILRSKWLTSLQSEKIEHQGVEKVDSRPGQNSAHISAKEVDNSGKPDDRIKPGTLPSVAYEDMPPKTKRKANPLLEISLQDDLDFDALLRIARSIEVTKAREYIHEREEIYWHRNSPASRIDAMKAKLEGTRRGSPGVSPYILMVCQAYRDHGNWCMARVKVQALRAHRLFLRDRSPDSGYLAMEEIKQTLEEHAKRRAERLAFYRKELCQVVSKYHRRDMLSEFPDLRPGELFPEGLPSRKSAESAMADGKGTALAGTSQRAQNSSANGIEDVKLSANVTPFSLPEEIFIEERRFIGKGSSNDKRLPIKEESPVKEIQEDVKRNSSFKYTEEGFQAYTRRGKDQPLPNDAAVLPTVSETTQAEAVARGHGFPLNDLNAALRAASETPPPASADGSPTDPSPSYTGGRLWTEAGNVEAVWRSPFNAKELLSTVDRILEPYLHKFLVRLASGDPMISYILVGSAASIVIIIVTLVIVLLRRARSSSIVESDGGGGGAVGLEALGWFQVRGVSPYSQLYEGVPKVPSSRGRRAGGDSAIGAGNTGGGEEENAMRGYLVTQFPTTS